MMINEKGEIHCALVIGKGQFTPTKVITVPRLELFAATTSVRVAKMLKEFDETTFINSDSEQSQISLKVHKA